MDITELYVCERCFSTEVAPGPCPRCGLMRRYCYLGEPGDACRRPPMDADGHLLSRAPQWWVHGHQPPRTQSAEGTRRG